MFGFGMGGYGSNGQGGQYRRLRYIRLGALLLLLVGGALLGHKGTGYSILRDAYLGLIIGGLVFTMSRRRGRIQGQRYPSASMPGGSGPSGSPSSPLAQGSAPPPPAGWYADPGDAALQRYWDGIGWGARRRWNGTSWVAE